MCKILLSAAHYAITLKKTFLFISGAILLSLYYLFLWDPYKNTGQPPTQIPHAQANSPPTPSPSSTTTPTSPQGNLLRGIDNKAVRI